jgi:Amt family ammonium transporter
MVFSTSDSVNVFFFLWAAILIFFMKAGFILLEIGQIRRKNVGTHMSLKFLDLSTVMIAYLVIGYGIAYGIQYLFGALSEGGVATGSYAHYLKMLMFAVAAVTIVTGAVAERIKTSGYAIGAIVIGALIYPLYEGLAWGGGWLGSIGYHDFAGSGVVHVMGGILGLTAAKILGPRLGRFNNGKPVPIPGHDTTYVVLGAFILAFGWYGFNIGSAAFIDESGANIASVGIATTMALAGGIIGSAVITKSDPIWCSNGMCAGLVAVCAGADLFKPFPALIVGLVAGILTPIVFRFVEERGIDDACGVTPVHAVSGFWGVIAVGIFYPSMLPAQIIGGVVAVVLAVVLGGILYTTLKTLGLLRVDEQMEIEGLDKSIYEMNVYPEMPMDRIKPL